MFNQYFQKQNLALIILLVNFVHMSTSVSFVVYVGLWDVLWWDVLAIVRHLYVNFNVNH